MTELFRHIARCNNATLPGQRIPVLVAGDRVGWILPDLARQAADCGAALSPAGLTVPPGELQPLARALADHGALRWRSEPFDVRARPDGPVLDQIDRGALPKFGITAVGVHLNGLVGDRLWVAHRSPHKPLDPGKLDHLVAGGVPAGLTLEQTLLKEAEEEAGLPPDLVRHARPVGTISYAMVREEGLRRDILHCYDVDLPEHFEPAPHDDEVERFELWELGRVLDTVRRTDDFKFNVNLVLIDLFIRRGMLPAAEARTLAPALRR